MTSLENIIHTVNNSMNYWNTDWLHRESMFILNKWGHADCGNNYDDLNEEQQAQLKAKLKKEIRTNTYNPVTKELVISNDRGDAYRYLNDYYTGLFMNDPNFDQLRDDYAIPINTVKDSERMRHTVCLLIIVVGSMIGQWMGIFQKFDNQINFWFGHQGYEYVDLGRF